MFLTINRIVIGVGVIMLQVAFSVPSICVADDALGLFDSQSSIGTPKTTGLAKYDSDRQEYRIAGAGKNMWLDQDECHFAWKKMKGDFILRTRAKLEGKGVELHRKLGWMVRSSLDANSPHVNATVHGDGLVALQSRRTVGGQTEGLKSKLMNADVIQLERKGKRYIMSVARFGGTLVSSQLDEIDLGDEVYVGLFVCSHNEDVSETGVFKNVRITVPAKENFRPYQDYLDSRLETLDVQTGERRVVFNAAGSIQAPNWTPDGKALIYNSKGRLYSLPLDSPTPVLLDTGFAIRNNNDHVLSPDGQSIGISHQAKKERQSVIYTVPVLGGTPKRVTDKAPSYLHGWSPDGKSLLYTGKRDGQFDIYRISTNGGKETRLTNTPALDDGAESSPDGKFIFFNSARTGKMQIWRMNSDGTDQQQLTFGKRNEWFPHVSPNGKHIVFLSFPENIKAEDHPFYKRVLLKMMNIDGGDPRIIAYVYGGQGSINVPSWSPDSRHIAFVSCTQRKAKQPVRP